MTSLRRWSWRLLLGALLVAYLRWLSPAMAPYAGGADSSGYLWSARLLRHGRLAAPIDVPRGFPAAAVGADAFAPLGARVRPGTWELVPTYPTGLPLHIAAASLFLDEESSVTAVLIGAAAATLLLLFVLGREAGLRRRWAVAACALLACSPLFLFLAVQPMSDVLATCWAEAAILCAWRAERRVLFAVLAGASLGMAALVRPTNALLILPVLVALPASSRRYAGLIAGGLPFAAFVALYQSWAYGHPLTSGYGDVSSAFSSVNVAPSLVHYVRWLPRLGSWLLVLVPAAAWAWRGRLARWRLVMGTWAVVVLGVYASYLLTFETWWSLRFVLPAFPPLIIASLAGLQEMTAAAERWMRTRAARRLAEPAALAIAAACAVLLVRTPQFPAYGTVKDNERVYQDALKLLTLEAPPGVPVLMVQTSGAANYYTPQIRFVRYDALSPRAWESVRAWQSAAGMEIAAALFPFEREEMFQGHRMRLPCRWESRGRYRYVTFWACPP